MPVPNACQAIQSKGFVSKASCLQPCMRVPAGLSNFFCKDIDGSSKSGRAIQGTLRATDNFNSFHICKGKLRQVKTVIRGSSITHFTAIDHNECLPRIPSSHINILQGACRLKSADRKNPFAPGEQIRYIL